MDTSSRALQRGPNTTGRASVNRFLHVGIARKDWSAYSMKP